MKTGFETEPQDTQEPETGHAETTPAEPSYWESMVVPVAVDFLVCYGLFAVIRDLIGAYRGGYHGTP